MQFILHRHESLRCNNFQIRQNHHIYRAVLIARINIIGKEQLILFPMGTSTRRTLEISFNMDTPDSLAQDGYDARLTFGVEGMHVGGSIPNITNPLMVG
jgi:hypothetical protein